MATTANQIKHDLPCKGCQYNLRGLAVDRTCPECGLPVHMSQGPPGLYLSDPRWVRRLAIGSELVWWGMLTIFVASMAAVPVTAVSMTLNMSAEMPMQLVSVVSAIALLTIWSGVFLLTTSEPDPPGGKSRFTRRRLTRAGLLLIPVLMLAPALGLRSGMQSQGTSSWLGVVAMGLGVIGAYLLFFAGFAYFRQLLQRIPAGGLKPTWRTLVPWFVSFGLAGLVLNGTQLGLMWATGPWPALMEGAMAIGMVIFAVASVAMFAFFFGSIFAHVNWLRKGLWLSVASE